MSHLQRLELTLQCRCQVHVATEIGQKSMVVDGQRLINSPKWKPGPCLPQSGRFRRRGSVSGSDLRVVGDLGVSRTGLNLNIS